MDIPPIHLGFGLLDKVVLRFDEPHWAAEPDVFGVLGADAPVTKMVPYEPFDPRLRRAAGCLA